ncbi:MAG TPA: hypothetical protein VFW68_15480 [Rhodocyclaceae bacterium]|nr:hypothetical protein [Rhodocyclaceae bacterium]
MEETVAVKPEKARNAAWMRQKRVWRKQKAPQGLIAAQQER